ncbi:MAG: putative anti-sigma regulatory factor, serine/threonine protein kinase, partial [Modestobacter sp.]|nr:putative anti-sigma regulatory factor, serine/threonine protein kinase [Modestobacter sp.]
MVQPSQDQQIYRHVGHVLSEGEDVATVVAPFLRNALSAGEPVVIACPDPVATALATALGNTEGVHVAPADPLAWGPSNALAAVTDLVDRDLPGDGRRLHLVTCPG